ncbi:MAG: hydroxyisourate hydrolase [Rhodospirillales bacterium]|nr:MAG: hydroxyisourate hydrolase [Rhodospirillales bacterium]
MAGGISIHVVDVSRGVPAHGLRVALRRLSDGAVATLFEGAVDARGLLPMPPSIGDTPQPAGVYEAVFAIGAYYRARDPAAATPAFVEDATFRFGIAEPSQHYHLPLKMTAWGYSLFRGGA